MKNYRKNIEEWKEKVILYNKKIDKIDAKMDREAADASFHDRILFKNLETVMNTLNLKMTITLCKY